MTYICRTHIFKVVLSLVLLNYLRFLKSTKKNLYLQKNILIFTPKFGSLSLVGGPRRWPKCPRPRAGPGGSRLLQFLFLNSYQWARTNKRLTFLFPQIRPTWQYSVFESYPLPSQV